MIRIIRYFAGKSDPALIVWLTCDRCGQLGSESQACRLSSLDATVAELRHLLSWKYGWRYWPMVRDGETEVVWGDQCGHCVAKARARAYSQKGGGS